MFKIIFLCLLSLPAFSAESLVATDVWARATPPGARSGAIYLTLENSSTAAIGISELRTNVATMAHLHTTALEDGMMRMRQLEDFTIDAGERVLLAPGGTHIMLMGLKGGLNTGDSFELEIVTTDGSVLSTAVSVGTPGQMSATDK